MGLTGWMGPVARPTPFEPLAGIQSSQSPIANRQSPIATRQPGFPLAAEIV